MLMVLSETTKRMKDADDSGDDGGDKRCHVFCVNGDVMANVMMVM